MEEKPNPEIKITPKYKGLCPQMFQALEDMANPITPSEEVKPLELPEKREI